MPDMNYREKLLAVTHAVGRAIDHDIVESKLQDLGILDELEAIDWGSRQQTHPGTIFFEGVKDGHIVDFSLEVSL